LRLSHSKNIYCHRFSDYALWSENLLDDDDDDDDDDTAE